MNTCNQEDNSSPHPVIEFGQERKKHAPADWVTAKALYTESNIAEEEIAEASGFTVAELVMQARRRRWCRPAPQVNKRIMEAAERKALGVSDSPVNLSPSEARQHSFIDLASSFAADVLTNHREQLAALRLQGSELYKELSAIMRAANPDISLETQAMLEHAGLPIPSGLTLGQLKSASEVFKNLATAADKLQTLERRAWSMDDKSKGRRDDEELRALASADPVELPALMHGAGQAGRGTDEGTRT